MNHIKIRNDRNVPLESIKALWDQIPQTAGRDLETIDLTWHRSAYIVHAWSHSQMVGIARVLTDGGYYAWVCEVAAAPGYDFLRAILLNRPFAHFGTVV